MWMIGSLMMRVGAVVLLLGMLAGIDMGIREDFALAPAHAHLNLVGGVLLFLFGLYYRVVPAAGSTTLAKTAGLAPYRRCDRVSGRRRSRHSEGTIIRTCGGGWIVDCGRGDGAICGDRVSVRAGIAPCSLRWVARRPPSLFKPIRGIVRRTDSLRHGARNT
jgi:hypothetical protein